MYISSFVLMGTSFPFWTVRPSKTIPRSWWSHIWQKILTLFCVLESPLVLLLKTTRLYEAHIFKFKRPCSKNSRTSWFLLKQKVGKVLEAAKFYSLKDFVWKSIGVTYIVYTTYLMRKEVGAHGLKSLLDVVSSVTKQPNISGMSYGAMTSSLCHFEVL